jgi:hypothetical protein
MLFETNYIICHSNPGINLLRVAQYVFPELKQIKNILYYPNSGETY